MKVCTAIQMLILSVVLCSCAGQLGTKTTTPVIDEYAGVSRIEGASIETVQTEPKVVSGYENIVLNPLQMSSQFAKDYPQMKNQFIISAIGYLRDKDVYKRVEGGHPSKVNNHPKKTLIVDTKVVDMRMVGSQARFWAGAMAGSSSVSIYLKLTDAASHKMIHEKIIATSYNAFASEWNGSEKSLPIDMGQIIGEYIYTVAPVK